MIIFVISNTQAKHVWLTWLYEGVENFQINGMKNNDLTPINMTGILNIPI